MAISLTKGQNVALDKGLNNVHVGLGWDARDTTGETFDLDASCFLLDGSGKVRKDADFIFYNQLKSPCGSVEHTGDNLTGDGDGDDEVIQVRLDKVPADVQRIVFVVTIHESATKKQTFGQVDNAVIRIVNNDSNEETARYELTEDASINTAMIFGELYRKDGAWKFKAIGQGYSHGLLEVAKGYGVKVS